MATRVIRRCALLLACVALSALLAACATAGTAHPPSVISFSYVYGDQSTAVLLQWTSHGHGPVSGTIKIKSIAGSDLFTSPTDTSAKFTGTVDAKGAVTLTLPDWGTVRGTQQDIGLLMMVPAKGGGQQAAQFYPGSQSLYDSALRLVNKSASQTEDSTVAPVDDAAANLGQDVGTLDLSAQSFPSVFDSMNNDMASTANDAATTQTDVGTTLRDAHESRELRCADMSVADEDVKLVGEDGSLVTLDEEAVLETIKEIRQESDQVKQDLAQVQHLQPGYRGGGGQPSPTQVHAAVTKAASQVATAVSTANGDADKVNSYLRQAYQATAAAARTDGCGAPEGAPTPVNHIK